MMRYLKGLAVMAGMLAASLGSAQLEPWEGKFKVVDEAGNPVADAEVIAIVQLSMVVPLTYSGITDMDGTIVLDAESVKHPDQARDQELKGGHISVTKEGFGTTIMELSKGEDDDWQTATVTLTTARPFTLKINAPEDADLSDLELKLIPESFGKMSTGKILDSRDFFVLEELKDGLYRGMFGAVSEAVYCTMKLEGYNDYQMETISASQVMDANGETITIDLQKGIPVAVTTTVKKPQDVETLKGNRFNLHMMSRPQDDKPRRLLNSGHSKEGEMITLSAMLPPGEYLAMLDAWTNTPPIKYLGSGQQEFSVAATDESVSEDIVISIPVSINGDEKIAVTLKNSGGNSAKGLPYRLTKRNGHKPLTEVRTGVVPDDSVIKIDGLGATSFGLEVNGVMVSEEITLAYKGKDTTQHFDFIVPPGVGDPMIDLDLIDMETGEAVKLSDYKGKVVFLDFWATWCGPCQQPMAHNSEVVARRSDWEGKAAVVALSIDDTMDVLEKHVPDKGWGNLEHLYAEEGGTGWNSKARNEYGVSGIPTCFLIDQKGTIVWRGHPSSFNLEEEIDKLLAANSGE